MVTVCFCWILPEEDRAVMIHYLVMTGREGNENILCLGLALQLLVVLIISVHLYLFNRGHSLSY